MSTTLQQRPNGCGYKTKTFKALGTDGLSSIMLKHIGPNNIDFRTSTLNLSLSSLGIPSLWKVGIVILIFKPYQPADLSKSYLTAFSGRQTTRVTTTANHDRSPHISVSPITSFVPSTRRHKKQPQINASSTNVQFWLHWLPVQPSKECPSGRRSIAHPFQLLCA